MQLKYTPCVLLIYFFVSQFNSFFIRPQHVKFNVDVNGNGLMEHQIL